MIVILRSLFVYILLTIFSCIAVNMIAHRFKFTNPQDYGLYILISGVGTGKASNYQNKVVKLYPQDFLYTIMVQPVFTITTEKCVYTFLHISRWL
jgi:hypothetical protein